VEYCKYSLPYFSPPSPQSPATMQPVGVNMFAVRLSAESNMSIPQGQGIANSIKSNLNSSAIPYNCYNSKALVLT